MHCIPIAAVSNLKKLFANTLFPNSFLLINLYDSKTHNHQFTDEDIKNLVLTPQLASTWLGPYEINKMIDPANCIIKKGKPR